MNFQPNPSICKALRFKELENASYFQHGNKIYQKISKTKIREFGESQDIVFRKNPEVLFLGFSWEDFLTV